MGSADTFDYTVAMQGTIIRILITAAGLWLADALFAGVRFDGAWTLLFSALVLGIINAIVRPVLVVLTLPLTVVTLGLFLLVLNAAMFGLAAAFFAGFQVDGFWYAVGGALVVSITSWVGSAFIGQNGRYEVMVIKRRGE